ncbi:MAG: class I SAM-dependent methyltransferase [Desulfosudaceae bacterium]
MPRKYQHNFSAILPEAMYNRAQRERKAETMRRVLQAHFIDTEALSVLDVSASAGFIDAYLADHFYQVTGVDIDVQALNHARTHLGKKNLTFARADALNLPFARERFEVVICTHLYEHVPDAACLMREIYRVLTPGGVCYFAAGNRLQWMEPHYRLPLLSCLPRPLAQAYFRLSGRGNYYYEKHLTRRSLKKLVKNYRIIDYTAKIVNDPEKYAATYMLVPDSWQHAVAEFVVAHANSLFPTYIWLLEKPVRVHPGG